jgi:hypothetical protein
LLLNVGATFGRPNNDIQYFSKYGLIVVGDDAHIVPNVKLLKYGLVAEKHIDDRNVIDMF